MILLVVLSIIIFPTFVVMNYTYFPINVRTCDATVDPSNPNKLQNIFMSASAPVPTDPEPKSPCELNSTELEVRVGFQIYTLGLMTFVGWLLLCVFMPTGMQGLVFDLGA